MSKHSKDTQPLLKTREGDAHTLTFEYCKTQIIDAGFFHRSKKAEELRSHIRNLSMVDREGVLKDFCKHGKSKALSNGNRTVYSFYCDVLRNYAEDKHVSLLDVYKKFPPDTKSNGITRGW